jgi:1,4-alpha-glucan branching enzyme
MTIHFDTDAVTGTTNATFTIEGHDQSAVSVVGSFNDWTPGRHPFGPAEEGLLSATVPVHPGDELHFRYLAADGNWFDDPEADSITEYGSVVTVPDSSARPAEPATPQSSSEDATTVSAPPADPDGATGDEPKAGKRSQA